MMGFLAIGVLLLLSLQSPTSEAGTPPAGATYVDTDTTCKGCHNIASWDYIWTTWNQTNHATAWPTLNQSGNQQEFCEPCHSTGAGKPSIFPATGFNTNTNLPVYLQNVTCQVCHGPGSDHADTPTKANIGLVLNSSLCGECHYSSGGLTADPLHHPTYNEWELSGHNSSQRLASFVKQPSCSNCHEAWNAIKYLETHEHADELRETGEDAPITWEIACATCHNPMSPTDGTQLRVPADEICQRCHNSEGAVPGQSPHHPQSEVRNNTAGFISDRSAFDYMPDVPCSDCHMANNRAGLPNHTFIPDPAACNDTACHGGAVLPQLLNKTASQQFIDNIIDTTDAKLTTAGPLVTEAEEIYEQMLTNRTDPDHMADMTTEFEIAIFNYETVESDKSEGNHNPSLVWALLNDSIARAPVVIEGLTPPSIVTGIVVTDEGGGAIKIEWNANTDTDFAGYRIYVLTADANNVTEETWEAEITAQDTTNYTVEDLEAGETYYVFVTAVDTDGNEITNGLTSESIELAGAGISTTMWAIIIAVIVIIALVAVMMMRKKGPKPGEVPPAEPEKPEE